MFSVCYVSNDEEINYQKSRLIINILNACIEINDEVIFSMSKSFSFRLVKYIKNERESISY